MRGPILLDMEGNMGGTNLDTKSMEQQEILDKNREQASQTPLV